MHKRVFVVISMVIACDAASLQSQSSSTFAAAYGCDLTRIKAAEVAHRPGASYAVFDVRGCGLRQIYYCAVDVGCMRPEEAHERNIAPGTGLPPTLVDPAPLAPPVLAPDSQSGS